MIRTFTRRGWTALVGGAGAIIALPVAADRLPPLALVNETPSLPPGLYLRNFRAEAARGSIVAVRQPAAARAYLSSLGAPEDMALIKRVAAVGGDEVCASGERLRLPGRDVRVLAKDGRGVRLASWPGCRVLREDEVFLLGDTEASFDSRYFGPVNRGDVLGVFERAGP